MLLVSVMLLAQLAYPILLIQMLDSHTMMALYFMIFTVGQTLKLVSFHHVMYDNRVLLRRIAKAGPQKKNEGLEELSTFFNVNKNEMELALQYPHNLNFSHYVRFLCAPTCCFQLYLPKS